MYVSFPDGSAGKQSACSARVTGDVGSVPGLGRSPGGGHGSSLQHSCLENPKEPDNYSPWGHETADSTEAPEHACMYVCVSPNELVVFL